jgi:putative endonuclease
MKTFFYVYILVSEIDKTLHHTGMTEDLGERLEEHNQGAYLSTSRHRPWRIAISLAFRSESKARAFERYLKSGSGREFARRHF